MGTCWLRLQHVRPLECCAVLTALLALSSAAVAASPVTLAVKTGNKVTLQVSGQPAQIQSSTNAIILTLKGAEKSQCDQNYGRSSDATGTADAVVIQHDPMWATITLSSDSIAHGGEFRTCDSCVPHTNLCVGIHGHDTTGSSAALAEATATIAFNSGYKHASDYQLFVDSQGQSPKLQLTDGQNNILKLKDDNGHPAILQGRPGKIFYLNVSLPSQTSDKGGGGSKTQHAAATVDIRLSKAPILYSGYIAGYIRGGRQTSSYKNVGVILLDRQVHCTGTVIGPKTVLTAAHCLNGVDKTKMTFVLGANYQYPDPAGGPFQVSDVAFPDGSDGVFTFNPKTYADDIGIIHLTNPVSVEPATLHQATPSWDEILSQHISLLFVGFGFNVIQGDTVGIGIKREGEWQIDKIDNRTISFAVPGLNTCYGDSGGPAFVESSTGATLLLAGITSGGNDDCTQGTDTRVDAYKVWLNGKVL